ncbi:MAG: gliding motility-associated C-terminal domain-containing protein [Saprospiraceae bacterium]
MKKIITLLLLGWLVTFSTTAQVVYNVSPSSSSADPGATIFVDVTVENFVDMIGFQFEMEWNDQVLEFQNITTYDNIMCNVAGNPTVCYSYPSGFGPATITSFFATQYLDPDFINPTPNTLANGEKLLTMEFLVVGQAGQSSPIDFRGAILAVDSDFNELSVANGMVTANDGTFNVNGTGCAGAGDVTFTASDESGDTGTSGSVKISVDNFENVEGFGYTINWDPSIISFTSIGNLNLAGLTNPAQGVGSFGTSQTSQGNLFVSWDNSSGVTACDGDIIFEIFYDIIGAGQTSTDVDFTGNIEVIRNSLLVPHDVNSGEVMVTGNGTGQNTGITFIAEDVTGETGTQVCVPVKVANFEQVISFQYEMTWDPAIISFATILDGAGQPLSPIGSGNPLGLLNPNPPAVGNFGSTNISNGVLSLSWDNSSGVTLTDQTPIYQVCYDIVGSAGETSPINYGGTIEVADVNGLADFTGVPGSVEVIEVFNGGLILEWDCCEKANPGDNICVDIKVVEGFDAILSAQYGMLWDNSVLTYESIKFENGNPLGLSVGNNLVYDANADAVKLLWFDNSGQGVTLSPGTFLYQVCFDVTGAVGTNSDLEMGPIPNANPPFSVEISNNQNTVDFLGNVCNVTVENILPLSITETVTNPSCVGDTDGAIDVTVTGGVEDYTYAWSTTATSQDISDLGAGNYTVTVTDCRGVTAEKTITLTDPTPVTGTANVTQVSGAGSSDGAIDLTPSGGTPGYTYLWSNASINEDLTNLSIGTYTVTITDSNGCTGTESFIVPNACNPITIGANTTPESSAGNDGSISAFSNGGTEPYSYTWNIAGGSNGNLTNLAAGTYTATVTDANGCTGTNSFIVSGFTCPTVTVSTNATGVTCAGGNTGTITANGAGGTEPYIYTWSNGLPSQQTVNGLAAGTYAVTATDADGCFATTSVVIEDGASLLVNIVSTTDITCFGGNTGSITISGFGGAGPYSAVWQPGNMSGLTINNLVAGSYTPVITDISTGCTATGNAITLTQPSDISISGSATNTSCNGGSDGSISLNISGGTPNYSVSWSNGGSGQNLNGLTAGTYTPTVTDANGCVKIGAGITVEQPATITATATINGASCFGECDGSISLNISGGTPSYTVNWSNGATGTSISGLCAGNYSATIIDANGCTFSEIYSVTQPASFGLSFVVQNESPAGNDGAINLTVSPTGNYSFLWSNGATTEDINGLTADIYNVTVTDIASGCTAVGGAAVTNTLSIQTEIVTHVTCHDGNDGSIEITVSGGTPGYSYVWSTGGNLFAQTKDVFGLTAGTYTVAITDLALTTITKTYVITEPTAVTITNVVIIDESDICDGSINITVAGGMGPYTYLWSNGEISEDIVNLCEDDYSVTITDSKGCIYISDDYTIEPSSPQIGGEDITDVTCFGDCDGVICVDIVGGNAPYTVTINNTNPQISTATTVCFGGLCPGNYVVQVTDAQGLFVSSMTYTVGEPAPITISGATINNETSAGCDGGVNIMNVQGGNGGYTYLWSNGDISQDLGPVCAGSYQLTITDSEGCTFVSDEYEIVKLISFEAIITDVACFGDSNGAIDLTVLGGVPPYTFVWTDANGIVIPNQTGPSLPNRTAGDFGVMITDAVGTSLLNVSMITIGQPVSALEITSTLTVQPTAMNCEGGEITIVVEGGTPGYDYEWTNQDGTNVGSTASITGLVGGMYTVVVTDENGCTTTAESELEECQISLSLDLVTQLMVTCNGDSDATISLVAEGGTEPYTYDWDTGFSETGIDGSMLENLAPGTYEITATDANGVTTTGSYIVLEPAPIQATISVSTGRAEAIVLGGTAPYTFQWDQVITTEDFVEGLQGGIEHVLMVTDANGCTSELYYFDLDYDTGCYEARTVISPNNDGLNDNFYVNCLETTTVKVIIFNRWGQEVYQNDDYDNSFIGVGRRDQVLPQGGYFYVLEYEDANGVIQTSRGSLSIVR